MCKGDDQAGDRTINIAYQIGCLGHCPQRRSYRKAQKTTGVQEVQEQWGDDPDWKWRGCPVVIRETKEAVDCWKEKGTIPELPDVQLTGTTLLNTPKGNSRNQPHKQLFGMHRKSWASRISGEFPNYQLTWMHSKSCVSRILRRHCRQPGYANKDTAI